MKENRRHQIQRLIEEKKSLSMYDLCDYLNVSMNTVRKDVEQLVRDGIVEKVYGGIVWKETSPSIPIYESRSTLQSAAKQRIAKYAAGLISNNDVIFIDSGTTTMYILNFLNPAYQITVVTSSIAVLEHAQSMENVRLLLLPGFYDKRTNSVLDNGTVEFLSQFKYTKAMIAASALTVSGELSVSNYIECEFKRTAMERSQENYLLIDSTKYGRMGLLSFGHVEQMRKVITDQGIAPDFTSFCQEKGVELVQV